MIPGFTSTGSKHPRKLFGTEQGVPRQMRRSEGCRLWDVSGREYVDYIMALGAVSLGYAHPAVTEAVTRAVKDGVVGSLAPELEERVAARLCRLLPSAERVRFLKTGAEAMAAAVRIARAFTGKDIIVTCGYHGWLDTFSDAVGVPVGVKLNRHSISFNNVEELESTLGSGDDIAAVLVEPVVDGPPTAEWVNAINVQTKRIGAVLVLDEIKTGLRLGVGGAQERYGFKPGLTVLGKAIGNGFPCAVVCGLADIMAAVEKTWVSSTLATEFVSLAAVNAVLHEYESARVAETLSWVGGGLYIGLEEVAQMAPRIIKGVKGIPEFCYLDFVDDETGWRVTRMCAEHGMLFKRDAYNFVSNAHTSEIVQESLTCLTSVVEQVAYG